MRYALDLVRASRPKSPNAPDCVKKWVAFGASVRAAQYLCSARKARALMQRPVPRQLRRHPRARAPGAAPPRADQLPRAVGGRDERHARSTSCSKPCRCRDRGCRIGVIQIRAATMQNECDAIPGARFVDPDGARADREPRARGAARSSTGSSTGCTARRTSARRWTSPSTAATCRATTSAASTGGCTRAPTATTSRSTRPTPTRTSRSCSMCRNRWASASRGITKLDYAQACSPGA